MKHQRFCLPIPCLLIAASAVAHALETPCRPNVVIILADDLGYGSTGCYGASTNLISTPNINRIANEGMRFTNAITPSSVCSPTRYALLTGRYAWRTRLQYGTLNESDPLLINEDQPTVASILHNQGYHTAAIGKWHLGYGKTKPVDYTVSLIPGPHEVGFDYHYGIPCNHGDSTGIFIDNETVFGLRSPEKRPFGQCSYGYPFLGIDAPQRVNTEVMPLITTNAVKWIEQQDATTPFFLYYTPVAVHEPVTPSLDTSGTSKAGPYGDWIHELDLNVGKVLNAIDRKGFTDNTLIIFTSDNGADINRTRSGTQLVAISSGLKLNGNWRGGKHGIYEGGFRVPYIVRWPGKICQGAVNDSPIGLVDTFATIADISKATIPHHGGEDSHSRLTAYMGETDGAKDEYPRIEHSGDGTFAVRLGDWKWIEGIPVKRNKIREIEYSGQLYNLHDDPGEERDLISSNAKLSNELSSMLQASRGTLQASHGQAP